MKIHYYIRYVYGLPTIYPHSSCAHEVQVLTRRKTLTVHDLDALRALGLETLEVRDEKFAKDGIPCSNMRDFDKYIA